MVDASLGHFNRDELVDLLGEEADASKHAHTAVLDLSLTELLQLSLRTAKITKVSFKTLRVQFTSDLPLVNPTGSKKPVGAISPIRLIGFSGRGPVMKLRRVDDAVVLVAGTRANAQKFNTKFLYNVLQCIPDTLLSRRAVAMTPNMAKKIGT